MEIKDIDKIYKEIFEFKNPKNRFTIIYDLDVNYVDRCIDCIIIDNKYEDKETAFRLKLNSQNEIYEISIQMNKSWLNIKDFHKLRRFYDSILYQEINLKVFFLVNLNYITIGENDGLYYTYDYDAICKNSDDILIKVDFDN